MSWPQLRLGGDCLRHLVRRECIIEIWNGYERQDGLAIGGKCWFYYKKTDDTEADDGWSLHDLSSEVVSIGKALTFKSRDDRCVECVRAEIFFKRADGSFVREKEPEIFEFEPVRGCCWAHVVRILRPPKEPRHLADMRTIGPPQ